VVSLAILGEEAPNWRLKPYRSDQWNSRLCYEFPTVKLLDLAALQANPNPFATAVLAQRT